MSQRKLPIQGGTIGSGANENLLTPYDIFFNKVLLTDVDFTNVDMEGANEKTQTVRLMRAAVAKWYYIMRLIASIILLAILVVVGIKMAISSVAEEKALYKKALVDWAVSLALIFLLQFIISFTVLCNNGLVKSLAAIGSSDSADISDTIEDLKNMAMGAVGWETIAATIVYVAISVQTLAFLFQYIKRMINIGFLIIISPLISITYSIDRMGDGKSQALNTWLKEFVFGVIIQPFHCVLYLAFVDMAFQLLKGGGSSVEKIANGALAVMCITFVDDGEKIVKKIFGLDASSAVSPVAAGAMLGATAAFASQKAPQMLAGAKKGLTNFTQKGLGAKIAQDYKKDRTDRFQNLLNDPSKSDKAKKALSRAGLAYGDDGKIHGVGADGKLTDDTFDKSQAAEKMYEARASKNLQHPVRTMKEAASKKFGSMAKAHRETKIDEMTQAQIAEMNPEMQGRYDRDTPEGNAAYEALRAENAKKYDNRHAKIKGFVSKVGNSETGKYIRKNMTFGSMVSRSVAGGAALFATSAGLAAPGQGVLTAAAAGLGTYAALKGLGSNSATTVSNTAAPYSNFSSREDAHTQINNIIANKSDYDDGSQKFRELETKLAAAIQQAVKGMSVGEASKRAKEAASQIKYQTTAHPEKMDTAALASILSKATGGEPVTKELFTAGADYKQHVGDANVCREAVKLAEAGYTNESIADKFFDASRGGNSAPVLDASSFPAASVTVNNTINADSDSGTTPPPTDGGTNPPPGLSKEDFAAAVAAITQIQPGRGDITVEHIHKVEHVVQNTIDSGDMTQLKNIESELNATLKRFQDANVTSGSNLDTIRTLTTNVQNRINQLEGSGDAT